MRFCCRPPSIFCSSRSRVCLRLTRTARTPPLPLRRGSPSRVLPSMLPTPPPPTLSAMAETLAAETGDTEIEHKTQQHVFVACRPRGTTPARARSGLESPYYRIGLVSPGAALGTDGLHFIATGATRRTIHSTRACFGPTLLAKFVVDGLIGAMAIAWARGAGRLWRRADCLW
jgi:hypothetical protein